MLTEWDEGQAIIMERNPDYFAGPAKIDRIVFKIVPDDNAKAEEMLEKTGCTRDSDGYWTRNGERISFVINATSGDFQAPATTPWVWQIIWGSESFT